jgi:hypothetical protein
VAVIDLIAVNEEKPTSGGVGGGDGGAARVRLRPWCCSFAGREISQWQNMRAFATVTCPTAVRPHPVGAPPPAAPPPPSVLRHPHPILFCVLATPRTAAGATHRATTTTIQDLLLPLVSSPSAPYTSTPTPAGWLGLPVPRCICELGMTLKMEKEAAPSRRGRAHIAPPCLGGSWAGSSASRRVLDLRRGQSSRGL